MKHKAKKKYVCLLVGVNTSRNISPEQTLETRNEVKETGSLAAIQGGKYKMFACMTFAGTNC